jgi:hypothetical protein
MAYWVVDLGPPEYSKTEIARRLLRVKRKSNPLIEQQRAERMVKN